MRSVWDAKCRDCGEGFEDETEKGLKEKLAKHQRKTQHRDGWNWSSVEAIPQKPGDPGKAGVGYWPAVPEN